MPVRKTLATPSVNLRKHRHEKHTYVESLSENLSVVYVRIQYFLTISRRNRDGKGCDWSSNKIISGNATRFDFGPYLLCMFTLHRTNKIPNRIFKALEVYIQNYLQIFCCQHIRSIGRRIAMRIRHPDGEL